MEFFSSICQKGQSRQRMKYTDHSIKMNNKVLNFINCWLIDWNMNFRFVFSLLFRFSPHFPTRIFSKCALHFWWHSIKRQQEATWNLSVYFKPSSVICISLLFIVLEPRTHCTRSANHSHFSRDYIANAVQRACGSLHPKKISYETSNYK